MSHSHHPRISILIAVRNEGQHLASTLESICEQSCPRHWLEVLILDGGSTDDTVETALSYKDRLTSLRILNNPGVLSAAGWNLGIAHARAPVVSLLSGHVSLPSNYYLEALNELAPEYAGIGGMAIPAGHGARSTLIAKAFSCLLGNGGATFMSSNAGGPVDTIAFGCYWKDALLSIGGFDEQIVRGQDWDLNLRLRSKGLVLWYLPALKVKYFTRTTYSALWKRQFLAGRWKRYIHSKSGKPFLLRHLLPAAFVAAFGILALSAIFWPVPAFSLLSILLISHIGIAIWQARSLKVSWRQTLSFWWAIWLIHVGYGAGMITGFAMRPVLRPANIKGPD